MYLRTTKRKNGNGTTVEYFHLAHNERHPITKAPTPKIIHNFGRADQLDKNVLERLCRSIAKVCGLQFNETPSKVASDDLPVEFPANLKQIISLEFGPVLVVEEFWNRLGLGELLKKICCEKNLKAVYERAIFAMVANRLSHPESKLGLWERWLEKVYLPSCREIKCDHLYESMDMLQKFHAEIEKAVFQNTANLLNLEVDLIFYDTTNASFAIDEEDDDTDDESGLRKRGLGKTGVFEIQVVIALAVTREGIPVRCWVFPGNTADTATVAKVKADLRDWKLGRSLFVADAGMNSEENRRELARGCGKYLLASRMGGNKEVRDAVLARRGRYKKIEDNLFAKEVWVGEGECRRRYILCFNPREADRQKSHRQEVLIHLENEFSQHPDHLAAQQWAIEILASKRSKRYLSIVDGLVKIDRKKASAQERYDGKWVIQTNDDTIEVEDAACGYKNLMTIEGCFRSLKSAQIHLRPMHHRLAERIESHIRICVLALLIERVVELTTKETWQKMLATLQTLQATRFEAVNHGFYRLNDISPDLKSLLKTLKIQLPKQVIEVFPLEKQP